MESKSIQHIKKLVILCGFAVTGLISVTIVGAAVYAAFIMREIPEIISNWGGIIIGFYFGSFFNFAKEILAADGKVEAGDA